MKLPQCHSIVYPQQPWFSLQELQKISDVTGMSIQEMRIGNLCNDIVNEYESKYSALQLHFFLKSKGVVLRGYTKQKALEFIFTKIRNSHVMLSAWIHAIKIHSYPLCILPIEIIHKIADLM